MDWWIDLLTIYAHNSELLVITALSLISTLYKSLHAKSSPVCCVLNSRSLATASNSGDSSASRVQVLSSQRPVQNTTLNRLRPRLAAISHQPLSLLFTDLLSTDYWHLLTRSVGVRVRVRVRVTLPLAVYRQSVRLCAKPLETHDQQFFKWTHAVIVLK
jgi:hypothetical protein